MTPTVSAGWGVDLILHGHSIQVLISLLFAIKMNLLESCFCDGLEAYPAAGDFVTGLSWLLQPLSAGTAIPGTSPLSWNTGLAWRLSDLSHTALPHSCLEPFLQCLAMRGSMWYQARVCERENTLAAQKPSLLPNRSLFGWPLLGVYCGSGSTMSSGTLTLHEVHCS